MRLGIDIDKPQRVLMIKAMAKGLLAAVLVFGWISMIDDLIRTFAADLTDSSDLQWALRSIVVWFTIAFIGAFVARERLHIAAVVFVLIYWVYLSTTGYLSGTSWGSDLPYLQFLALWMSTVIPSVTSCWIGAFLGWKYSARADRSKAKFHRGYQAVFLAAVFLLIFAGAPYVYSAHWKSQALEQVKRAITSAQMGEIPSNLDLYDDDPDDRWGINYMKDILVLLDQPVSETTFMANHKYLEGGHGYQIEIRTMSGPAYWAWADYLGGDGWRIRCCFKID